MLTVAELAARDGVSKPTVSIAVKKLVERHGLTVERDGQGRVARVNAAEYDHFRGRYGDPSKAQAPVRPEPSLPLAAPAPATAAGAVSDSYEEALRQKTWHEAEKRRLELEEIKGGLVRRDRLTDAMVRCAEEIVRVLERLPQSADDLAAAVAKEGSHGLRVALKALATKMRAEAAQSLARVASGAPATDEDEAGEGSA